MEPNSYSYSQNQKPNKWGKKQVITLLVIIGAILFVLLGWNTYQASHFRITSTDPKLGAVQEGSPYIKVKFNRTLSDKDLKVTGDMVKDTGLNDKDLEINLKGNRKVGSKHTVTIDSITSKDGEKITNKKLTFTVIDSNFDVLSDDQKKAIIDRQDRFGYSPETLPIDGGDALIEYGVSSEHMHSFWQALYNYSKSVNKEFTSIMIYQASINLLPYDKTKDYSSVQFTIEFDNETTYTAQLDGHGDLSTIRLTLTDPSTGAQVFDSGLVNKENIE